MFHRRKNRNGRVRQRQKAEIIYEVTKNSP